jgi:hypothetical protein
VAPSLSGSADEDVPLHRSRSQGLRIASALTERTQHRRFIAMKRFLPFVLAAGLVVGAAAPVAAQPNQNAALGALVGVLAQVAVRNVEILNDSDVDIITVDINDSLNNLLQNAFQNADIDILNDSLNRWNVLQDITIQDITVVGDDLVITLNLLGDTLVLS